MALFVCRWRVWDLLAKEKAIQMISEELILVVAINVIGSIGFYIGLRVGDFIFESDL